jgi:hypothetical protein
MINMFLINQLKLLEASADEESISPDDLYFMKHLPTGEVHKKSFKKSLGNDSPMNKMTKMELINHWNRTASSHNPITYMYWL